MREPMRLREGGDDLLAVGLLDAARAYRRPASTRNRILRALGLPIAFSVGAPAAIAIASSFATKVVMLVSAATIAVGGGAVAYQVHVRARARPARVSSAPRVVTPAATPRRIAARPPGSGPAIEPGLEHLPMAQALTPAPVLAVPSAAATAQRTLPRARLARATSSPRAPSLAPDPQPIAAPVVASAPSDHRQRLSTPMAPVLPPAGPLPRRAPLAREIALLDSAERAERRGDHGAALAGLDEYARAFPDGALLAEAEVLRISALLGGGNEAAARDHARMFLARYAPSPLAARVRSMFPGQSLQMKELP